MALLEVEALLECIWPCCRKGVTVGVGFEISFAQDFYSVTVRQLSVAYKIRTVALSATPHLHAFRHAAHHDDNELNL